MPRQRLPDGWTRSDDGMARELADPSHCVWWASITRAIASNHEYDDLAKCVPVDLALAIAREANADPIFSAAKRVVKLQVWDIATPEERVEFHQSVLDLAKIIDESEEAE